MRLVMVMCAAMLTACPGVPPAAPTTPTIEPMSRATVDAISTETIRVLNAMTTPVTPMPPFRPASQAQIDALETQTAEMIATMDGLATRMATTPTPGR